ncbi:hypothetical protein E2562_026869 [Oryza meyeriana var. granulata]|uniref:F-box domain-containing protein n=1 Tax=Oryza meyeriana var. granulata TaxID=110450 RepID=A0A6G1D930_9ORYZ|nr:hypothetical protein E2562_026869 [Oryza meyeriana var. granulata]
MERRVGRNIGWIDASIALRDLTGPIAFHRCPPSHQSPAIAASSRRLTNPSPLLAGAAAADAPAPPCPPTPPSHPSPPPRRADLLPSALARYPTVSRLDLSLCSRIPNAALATLSAATSLYAADLPRLLLLLPALRIPLSLSVLPTRNSPAHSRRRSSPWFSSIGRLHHVRRPPRSRAVLPTLLPSGILFRILVLDPAFCHHALLLQPPRDVLPNDHWRSSRRHFDGTVMLSRAYPSKLCFDAVCLTVDDKHPPAWVASYSDCSWRALSRDTSVTVEFDPYWFEGRSVHAA